MTNNNDNDAFWAEATAEWIVEEDEREAEEAEETKRQREKDDQEDEEDENYTLIGKAAKLHHKLMDRGMIDEMLVCFEGAFDIHFLCDYLCKSDFSDRAFFEQDFHELNGEDGDQEMEFYGKLISFCLRAKAALSGVPMRTKKQMIQWEYEATGAKARAEKKRVEKEKFDAEWNMLNERDRQAKEHFPNSEKDIVSKDCRDHFIETGEYVSLEEMTRRKGYKRIKF